MSPATDWKVDGDYFEGCDCNTVCPCVYLGSPDPGDCHVTFAWHISKGHFGPTKLDGLSVVAMFHAPGHMATGPKWNAALYLDSKASPAQAEALGKIFGGQAGGALAHVAALIGTVKGVKSTSIEFEKKGRSRKVRIPNVLDLEIEAVKGANEKEEATLHNVPMTGVPGFDPVVAQSKMYRYHDHGYAIELSGKNGFYSPFAYHP